MDELDNYNQSIEQIFILIKVRDIATNKGLTKPKDVIVYKDWRGNKKIRLCATRKKIEMFLNLRIDIILFLNTKFKKYFLHESSCISENEKDKILRIKKNN